MYVKAIACHGILNQNIVDLTWTLLVWLNSCLSNQQQSIELNGVKSPLSWGTCVLFHKGLRLFLIYEDDLPKSDHKVNYA